MQKRIWITAFAFLIFSGVVCAQFIKWGTDKTVPLFIHRGPDFGLFVKRVAFGKTTGPCTDELVDRMLLPDFQANHVDVIEREHLDQILAEHRLSQSGSVDASTAAQLGKILGPSAEIFVDVFSCTPQQEPLFRDQTDFSNHVHRFYISQTRFTLEGSVKVVDLTTGQVLGSHSFASKPQQENTAENAQPQFPPVDVVKDLAMGEARVQISNMFFPGASRKMVVFYDDKDCNLKDAYQLFERGDHDGSLKLLLASLDSCKTGKKDKALARAYYDVGLSYCSAGKFDEAKEFFQQAMQSKGAEAVAGTAADCAGSAVGYATSKAYREKFALIPDPRPIDTAVAVTPQQSVQPVPTNTPPVTNTPP